MKGWLEVVKFSVLRSEEMLYEFVVSGRVTFGEWI